MSHTNFNRVHELADHKRRRAVTQSATFSKLYGSNPQMVQDLADLAKLSGANPEQLFQVFAAAVKDLEAKQVHDIANHLSRLADEMERS